MPIRVSWYNPEKSIILREMQGDWTWEDFYNSQITINQMLGEVSHRVDQIIDTRQSKTLPSNALTNFSKASKTVPLNAGTRVVVGTNLFYQMLLEMLRRIFPNVADNVILTDSLEKAVAIITETASKDEQVI